VAADPHIVEHRLVREESEILEGTSDADLSDPIRRSIEQRAAFKQDVAAVGV
jgi:hypothetical protein